MEGISNFFARFNKILSSKYFIVEVVLKAFKEVVGVDIVEKDFEIKNGSLFFKKSGAIKMAVFLKKDLLIEKINKEMGKMVVREIR